MSDDNPSTSEIVKAATQGAAAGSIEALFAPVAGFLGKLLGPATDELGSWAGDKISFLRWRSRVRMMQRAQELLDNAGLQAHEVPRRVLMPILEDGADDDDPSMQERWAALLANAAAGSPIPIAYPRILAELEPVEARAIDFLSTTPSKATSQSLFGGHVRGLKRANIDNLARLALVRYTGEPFTGLGANPTKPEERIVATALAMNFIYACRAPTSDSV